MEPNDLAASLAKLPMLSTPETIEEDKSQPPTPDGTGRPANFHVIAPGLYRSSYPAYAHYETLADLELKTIITLVPETLSSEYCNFITSNGIIHHHIPILANKDPKVFSEPATVLKVMEILLDPHNYPLLLHCNKGKHRTGCMTACFRRICGWSLESCTAEYEKYSAPKDRVLDKVFIANFDPSPLKTIALERGYFAPVYRQPLAGDSVKSSNYSMQTVTSHGSDDTEEHLLQNDYQQRVKAENDAFLEPARRWSYK